MKREIAEIPEAVARLLGEGRGAISAVADAMRACEPHLVVTIARGSSDHAATYFKYGAEIAMGVPVASIGPSIASIYGVQMKLDRAVAVGISQSGQSPDIVTMLESAKRSGALAIAMTNNPASAMGGVADHIIDIHAGTERSVAATKTFVTSAVAGLALIAEWSGDRDLGVALERLPEALDQALQCDWTPLVESVVSRPSLFVLGRGPGFAVASEAALKFKETSGLHAEAYSTAEVLHGPSALVDAGFPVLALCADDLARPSILETCARLEKQGGAIHVTDPAPGSGISLPSARTGHPLTDPIAQAVSFYGFIEALSRRRGHNPDAPPHLRKETATV